MDIRYPVKQLGLCCVFEEAASPDSGRFAIRNPTQRLLLEPTKNLSFHHLSDKAISITNYDVNFLVHINGPRKLSRIIAYSKLYAT